MRFGTWTGSQWKLGNQKRDQINTQEESGYYPAASVIGLGTSGH